MQYWSDVQRASWRTARYWISNIYKVKSQSEPGACYNVCFLEDWSCACRHNAKRHANCKHIIPVQIMVQNPRYPTQYPHSRNRQYLAGHMTAEWWDVDMMWWILP